MKTKTYTLEELSELATQYLETKDDSDKNEWWITERVVCSIGVDEFLAWLLERQGKDEK